MKAIFIFIVILLTVLGQHENTADENKQVHRRKYRSPDPPQPPTIRKMNITSQICNRYATTMVQSYVNNPSDEGQETNFTMVLPKTAFISSFVIKIGNIIYRSRVDRPDIAKDLYDKAKRKGETVGHVAVRDTNEFIVSVYIEGQTEAEFILTYEELLERKNNNYELVISIFPGQIIDDLTATVTINESRALTDVRTPLVRSGKIIQTGYNEKLITYANIAINGKQSVINFTPKREQQKMFAQGLGTKESEGLAGQFAVRYDVKRDNLGGELLLQDNFFVHYLSLDEITPFPKHIIFVLDISGSMKDPITKTDVNESSTTKLQQLQAAMQRILSDLSTEDIFTIIPFTHIPQVLDFKKQDTKKIEIGDYKEPFKYLDKNTFPSPCTIKDVNTAKEIIKKFVATGGTNIIGALETALAAAKFSPSQSESNKSIQPLITILTDGKPYGGLKDTTSIMEIVTELNQKNQKVPIYTLSFGDKADQNFLRFLSIRNNGFSKHIDDKSDTSLQLYSFYKDISSPLLKNIEFAYYDSEINNVKETFPMLFKGSEIAVCGYYNKTDNLSKIVTVKAVGVDGDVILHPQTAEPATMSLEKLCAHLTVQRKLSEIWFFGSNKKTAETIYNLAKKHSLVTKVTSLIIEKPKPKPRFGPKSLVHERIHEVHYFAEFNKSSNQSDVLEELKAELSWLEDELDNYNILKNGQKSYLLGENYETLSDNDCTSKKNNETGKCTLLKHCPHVWPMLKNHNDYYYDYFCEIDEIYAGACCI